MNSQLSPKLVRLHQSVHSDLSSQKQAKYCLPLINRHIFLALRRHPALLNKALAKTTRPKSEVVSHRWLGELDLSDETFKYTGRMINYHILHRKAVRSPMELRNNISKVFNGQTSYSNMRYVRFFNLAQIAQDLHLPIEVLIYGTANADQIAEYNYRYFDSSTRYERNYLLYQAYCNRTLNSYITEKLVPRFHLDYVTVGAKCGVSKQTVSHWISTSRSPYMTRTRGMLDKLCGLGDTSPVKLLTFPTLSLTELQLYSESYIRKLSKSKRKRWLNEPIEWNPHIQAGRPHKSSRSKR